MTRSEGGGIFRQVADALGTPGGDMAHRVLHGGLWAVVTRIVTRGIVFVRTVILARLLAPQDFGLFGIAMLTQATLETALRFRVDAALIQRAEGTEQYLDLAWTIKIMKGLVVSGALFLTAPHVAEFFSAPRATPLLRVMGVVVLLQNVENIGVVYFRKELELRKDFALNLSNALSNAAVAIPAAVILGSAWALLLGILAGVMARVVVSYRIHPYRPALDFARDKFRDLFDFSKWVFGSSTMTFASTQGDDILLGRWLGAASLGVYQIAYRISNVVVTEVTNVISSVTFPAYSKLQARPARLREAFRATLSVTALIVVPLSCGIIVFVPGFVKHVLGAQWSEAVGPVRILAVAGLLRAASACWGPVYLSTAQTDKKFWKQSIRAAFTLVPAYPLTVLYGLEGMSLSVLAGITAALIYDLIWSKADEETGVTVVDVLKASAWPALATVAATTAGLGMSLVLPSTLVLFTGWVATYVVVYVATIAIVHINGQNTGVGEILSLFQR